MPATSALVRAGVPLLALALLVLPGFPLASATPVADGPLHGARFDSPPAGAPGPSRHPIPTEFPPSPSLGPRAAPLQVDPTAYYSSEPAPMGIADFGVNGATGSGYQYSTTEFWGVTTINSLSTKNLSLPDPYDATIQLNVNFEVSSGSNSYTYWTQDVAFLNTSDAGIEFIDNVWNVSASGADMYNSTITGNGTIASDGPSTYYFDVASYSAPGNDIYLTYPAQINLAMISSPRGSHPGVAFEFNDGSGWQVFDNIGLKFASGYTVNGFVVDGNSYNAAGLFDDAEMTLGGPGGGSQTHDSKSSMTMTLSYWNGHNFQQVTNAYGFGSDTAEGINNVNPTGEYWAENGTLYASETNGAGSLGDLYDRSFVGILNISSLLASGYVELNGTSYGTFAGRDMNITVAPGVYDVALYATNGSLVAAQNVTIGDGAYVALRLGEGPTYRVAFPESGLKPGTMWSVTFNGQRVSTTNATIAFQAGNGSYGFTVGLTPGFAATPTHGTITVEGAAFAESIVWAIVTYGLTFSEAGLAPGTAWGVTVDGVPHPATVPNLTLNEPNGSYSYAYAPVPGYLATPPTGVANVSGATQTLYVTWAIDAFTVSLTEAGLPVGTIWSATVDGVTHSGATATLGFGLANGTYAYSVTPIAGYSLTSRIGNLTVDGAPTGANVTFTLVRYSLVFSESGLPSGAEWSVTLSTQALTSFGPTIAFSLPNGTYSFLVATAADYVPTISGSSVAIDGQGGSLSIPFDAISGVVLGTIEPGGASVYLNGTLIRSTGGAVNVSLLPGTYPVLVQLTGYTPYSATITVRAGAVTPFNVTLQPVSPGSTGSPHASNGPGGLSLLEILALLGLVAVALAVVLGAWWASSRGRRRR